MTAKTEPPGHCAGKLRDERGAIMLIAVFIAIFLVGLLYYVIGISETLLLREKAQDAADAGVLSSAVMHARAMNVIVFINIIMAAILSVLVTVKLVETVAIIGIALAAASAWFTAGATLSFIPPLNAVRSTMQAIYSNLKEPVYNALTALHNASTAVQDATPVAAGLLTVADLEANATPPDTHGVVFPTRDDLPVESDSFSLLCKKAAGVPFALAHDTLGAFGTVTDLIQGPMQEIAGALSAWFCGDGDSGGAAPSSYSQSVDRTYPRTQAKIECEEKGDSKDKMDSTASSACSDEPEIAAEPDRTTGGCQTGHDCTLGGPYDTHVVLAREQCDPSVPPAPFQYHYQSRTGEVVYEYKAVTRTWVRQTPDYKKPVYEQSDRPPCGPAGSNATVAEEYNKVVRKHDDVAEVLPVCTNEKVPSTLFPVPDKTTQTVKFTEVLQILGCVRHETKVVDLSDAQKVEKSDNSKAPMRVQLQTDDGKSVNLGDENFQLRAILHTAVPGGTPERVMKVALWNHAAPENPLPSLLQGLRNFSVAQAEYFYDGADARSEWMWNMNWKARFRRVRLPEGGVSSAVSKFGGDSTGVGEFLNGIKSSQKLIVH